MTTTTGIDAPRQVETAIARASRATGIDFDYLMATAMRESSLNPSAKARTSSASGLFQFIESTWLQTVKEFGPQHGLDQAASRIRKTSDGRYEAVSPKARNEILKLRFDPKIASVMAGAFTQQNADVLSGRLGRPVTEGELYIAHFMGANGAGRLIGLAEASPDANAVSAFPREAAANKPIFRNRDGSARSVAEVYQALTAKHDSTPIEVASRGSTPGEADEIPDQPFLNMLGFFRSKPEAPIGEAAVDGFFGSIYRQGDLETEDTKPRDFGALSFLFGGFRNNERADAPEYRVSASDHAPLPDARPHAVDELVARWKTSADGGSPSAPLDLLAAQKAYRAAR